MQVGALQPGLHLEHCDRLARSRGMELAVDVNLPQPLDDIWRRDHPQWFASAAMPGATVTSNTAAEVDFWCADRDALWDACHAAVLALGACGVRILTAPAAAHVPLPFWEWLIPRVKRQYPDMLFVTGPVSPAHAAALAHMGFSQSRQPWLETPDASVAALLQRVASTDAVNPCRPFVALVSPTSSVQPGSIPRELAWLLAATLAPSYGLNEWPTRREDQDWLRRCNRWRRENRALQLLGNLRILETSNPQVLAFWRSVPEGRNDVLVVANLHPDQVQQAEVDCPDFDDAAREDGTVLMEDLVDAARYSWHVGSNPVRLDPARRLAHVLRVVRRPRLLL